MAKSNPNIPTVDIEEVDIDTGLVTLGTVDGTPPGGATYAGIFALEAVLQDVEGSGTYTNTGTVAVPAWTLFGTVASLADGKIFIGKADNTAGAFTPSGDVTITNAGVTAIGANKVTLAKLATLVAPSHVVKYAGNATWSGSGASKAVTVTGVLSTDIVTATIKTAPTQAAYLVSVVPSTDTVTITLSTANTSNDAVIAYQVLRATV